MAHVLIVDDEPHIRDLLGRYLDRLGHTTTLAVDGTDGVRHVEDADYDLIVTDIRMPNKDGIAFLREIHPFVEDRTPCIIITAFQDIEYAAEATRLGVCNFITKPFGLQEVGEAVRSALRLREGWTFRERYEQRLETELRGLLQAVLIDFVSELEQGTEAADHCHRVSEYAAIVATEMGVTGTRQLLDIQLGAMLHDIGKSQVPDAIRMKPAALSESEWVVMRQHPMLGAKIAGRFPALQGACQIIRHHHERYDGSGYPDGLAGEQIPLSARIFSVIDAFDTITEERCYQKARSRQEALAEVRQGAGTQFDPKVVEAFERTYPRICQILDVKGTGSGPRADMRATVSSMAGGFAGTLSREVLEESKRAVGGNGRKGGGNGRAADTAPALRFLAG